MHHYCLPTMAIVSNWIVMPIFHKDHHFISCCCSKYAATLESTPPESPTTSFILFSLLILQDCKVTMFYHNNCSGIHLIAPDFNAFPEVLMLISLTCFPISKLPNPWFLPFKTPFETTLPCGSLKVAGPLYSLSL
jgi:hypothetical protein